MPRYIECRDMVLLKASSIGHIARELIDSCSDDCRPSIHSVYPRTINITMKGMMIAAKLNRIRSETDIVIDYTYAPHIIEGLSKYVSTHTEISIRSNRIILGDSLIIDIEDTPIYVPQLRLKRGCPEGVFNIDPASVASVFLKTALILDKLYKEDLEILGLALKGVYETLEKCSPLGRGLGREIVGVLRNLIGLGKGLTPSSDDILAGFLSTYNNLAPRCLCSEPIDVSGEELRRTTKLSAYMISSASRGIVNEVIDSILTLANGDDPLYLLLDLAHLGHSSGVMMGIGALLALSTCKAEKSEEYGKIRKLVLRLVEVILDAATLMDSPLKLELRGK